jgi:maltose 6'-phosphate phosphatase
VESIKGIELTSGRELELWKKRCALGIKTPQGDFFSTHMGWWEDKDEPFSEQWGRFLGAVENKKTWIMGDFNAESHKQNQGYDLVTSSGFFDSYVLAEKRDEGFTVHNKIDGWDSGGQKRIDYIFCNFPARIKYSKRVFDGKNYGIVSDHFGVAIETEE